jgi:hypothetical protein
MRIARPLHAGAKATRAKPPPNTGWSTSTKPATAMFKALPFARAPSILPLKLAGLPSGADSLHRAPKAKLLQIESRFRSKYLFGRMI